MSFRKHFPYLSIFLALTITSVTFFFLFLLQMQLSRPTEPIIPGVSTEESQTFLDDKDFLAYLNPDGTLALNRIGRTSFQLNGWLMEILPDGTPRFTPPMAPEARPQATQIGTDADWSEMFDMWGVRKSSGTAVVYAVAIVPDYRNFNIFVGGDFDIAGTKSVSNIAMWNRGTGKWLNVGGGLDGVVRSMALGAAPDSNGSGTTTDGIYVVGDFTTAGGTITVNRVAFWDLATNSWKAVGNGVTSPGAEVHCVTVFHYITGTQIYPYIYIGGNFSEVSNTLSANNVAFYNTHAQRWQKLLESGQTNDGLRITGSGSVPVRTCTHSYDRGSNTGTIYFGGDFDTAGDGTTGDEYIIDSTAKRGINRQRNKPKAGLKRMAKEPGTAEKGTQKQK